MATKRHMLQSDELERIFSHKLTTNNGWQKASVKVDIGFGPENGLGVAYYYNKKTGTIVIPSPLATAKLSQGDGAEPTYKDVIARIQAEHSGLKLNFNGIILGKGNTERHYAAFHTSKENKITIFDSKISNMSRFLNSADAPKWWPPTSAMGNLWAIITLPVKALLFQLGAISVDTTQFHNQPTQTHRLGTQAFYNGVDCGYHSAGAVLSMTEYLLKNDGISNEKGIVDAVQSQKSTSLKTSEDLLKDRQPIEPDQEKSSTPITSPTRSEHLKTGEPLIKGRQATEPDKENYSTPTTPPTRKATLSPLGSTQLQSSISNKSEEKAAPTEQNTPTNNMKSGLKKLKMQDTQTIKSSDSAHSQTIKSSDSTQSQPRIN